MWILLFAACHAGQCDRRPFDTFHSLEICEESISALKEREREDGYHVTMAMCMKDREDLP